MPHNRIYIAAFVLIAFIAGLYFKSCVGKDDSSFLADTRTSNTQQFYPTDKKDTALKIEEVKQSVLKSTAGIRKYVEDTLKPALDVIEQAHISSDTYVPQKDSIKTLSKTIDSLTDVIKGYKPSLVVEKVFVHDTLLSYRNDPMIKDYYGHVKASKIGFGQNVLPLYGLRWQGLAIVRLYPNVEFSLGTGIRYDYNRVSTLLGGYYNFTTNKISISANTRIDILRF